ncbi:MAG: hypothetical protein KAX16_04195 [Actinomycetia bacterium]|nr:hypothetical protein [Actinomycetes bacterium]
MGKEYRRDVQVITTPGTPIEPIFVEDFDWDYDLICSGDWGWVVERDPTEHVAGRASLHMMTTNQEVADKDVRITFYPPMTEARYREYIITFKLDATSDGKALILFDIRIPDADLGDTYRYMLRLDLPNLDLELEDVTGWHKIGDIQGNLAPGNWYTIRFVIDFLNKNWVQVEFENQDINVSAYAQESITANNLLSNTRIELTTTDTYPLEMWIDKIIVRALDFLPEV